MGRTGTKLGGKLNDNKAVLAERLAHWLNRVVLQAGRAKPVSASEEDMSDGECCHDRSRQRKQTLVEHTQRPGEIPSGVEVTEEQTDSALGRTMATELNADISEAVDGDTKEEEEAREGHRVNPNGVDSSCVSGQPDAPGIASADIMGWEADLPVRRLSRVDFACTAFEISRRLNKGLSDLTVNFLAEFQRGTATEGYQARVHGLDPAQQLIVDVMAE